MTACRWPVAQLLPHSGDAILIDTVDDWDAESLSATALVKSDGLYAGADGSLPPWMGLEIMAQAVGAWAGCQARHEGREVGLGFLLGTRRYECHVTCFPAGARLSVRAVESLRDATGMGVFECEVREGGELLAFARLNVYSPADAGDLTREAAPADNDAAGGNDSNPDGASLEAACPCTDAAGPNGDASRPTPI